MVTKVSYDALFLKDFKAGMTDLEKSVIPAYLSHVKKKWNRDPDDFMTVFNVASNWNEVKEGDCGTSVLYYLQKFVQGCELEKIQINKFEIEILEDLFTWLLLRYRYNIWQW